MRSTFGCRLPTLGGVARVVIEHLTRFFQEPRGKRIRAVEDASLTVEDKELLVLVGPSGCGKTTTLRLIAGLDEPDAGAVFIDGLDMSHVAAKDRDIAMVFQNYALYPHMSAYENMAFGLKLRKLPRPETERRVKEAAEMLDLGDCLNRIPSDLSGGQRQRVAVGRAIVRRPKVFLFDEPLSNLDAQMRVQMRAEISRLHHRLAATMIYVTHDQGEAMTLGHRIAVMKTGVIQQVDEPLKLYGHPANLFVAGFIGSPPMNLFHGMVVRRGDGLFFQPKAGEGAPAPAGIAIRLEDGTTARMGEWVGKPILLGDSPGTYRQRPHPGRQASRADRASHRRSRRTIGVQHACSIGERRPFVCRLCSGDRPSGCESEGVGRLPNAPGAFL